MDSMTELSAPTIDQIEGLLAENGYEVTEVGENLIRVREMESGIAITVALQDNIAFFAVNCKVVPVSRVSPDAMRRMLAHDNGISTSAFQLYATADDKVAITLNNFCKLQNMGPEDQDDILSCVTFLLADVVEARDLLAEASL